MFFKNYPQTLYKFGTETSLTAIQDLSAYVDLIDQVKDNINFYQEYTILDGDRPDTLSSKLYGSIAYYWTFFLLNDSIRQQGWPLTAQEIRAKAAVDYPNTTVTTRDVDHHYEDVDGHADVDPRSAPGALLTAVTYLDRYVSANDTLKEIKVIKPSAIGEIFSAYQEALRTV